MSVSDSLFDNNSGSVAAAGASTLHVLGSWFTSNHAAVGGALRVLEDAVLIVNSSTVSNNSVEDGPALLAEGNSTLSIFNSTISNHVGHVAAVRVGGASNQLVVANSTFVNTTTPQDGFGGAMHLLGGFSNISNSIFVSNIGGFGAAIFMQGVRLTVADCEFKDNDGAEGGVAHVKEDSQVRRKAA